jgi:hypothetical protein
MRIRAVLLAIVILVASGAVGPESLVVANAQEEGEAGSPGPASGPGGIGLPLADFTRIWSSKDVPAMWPTVTWPGQLVCGVHLAWAPNQQPSLPEARTIAEQFLPSGAMPKRATRPSMWVIRDGWFSPMIQRTFATEWPVNVFVEITQAHDLPPNTFTRVQSVGVFVLRSSEDPLPACPPAGILQTF